jgi:hypothetical protein
MAAGRRRYSVESIAGGDLACCCLVVLRCLPLPELGFVGAMYTAAGESKTTAFFGPSESCFPPAVSS